MTALFLFLFFITFGFLVSILYFVLQQTKKSKTKDLPTDKDKQELEYKTLNENVQSRGESTLVSGTIILTASVLVMVESLRNDLAGVLLVVAVLTSLALYAVWLLAYSTTRRLDDFCLARMRELEEKLGINIHRLLYDEVQKRTWYRAGRLIQWMLFFWILLVFGLIILLLKL
jgi:hypothetical protein